MELECNHGFCRECLQQQLQARWPGPRVVFGYLNCALCRAPIAHPDLEGLLQEHNAFKRRAVDAAARKFREDGLARELSERLGRAASDEEVCAQAGETMAVFMCCDCDEPYCGGRADCAALAHEEAGEQARRCHECDWAAQATANDRRCMVHGHLFAVYKCDSCCSVAVWCCDGHHYCDRCHNEPCEDKHYPCPGPDKCPLRIPHPRNGAGNIGEPMEQPSFVIGCSACLGYADVPQDDLGGPDGYAFGYPPRDWAAFGTGAELLAAVGEEEVRGRLRAARPQVPQDGLAAECAERLLLREQGARTPQALLASAGGVAQVRQRLAAVGLSCDGQPQECAQRLLFLLEDAPLASLLLWDAHEALRPPNAARARRQRRRQRNRKGGGGEQPPRMDPSSEGAHAPRGVPPEAPP